MRRSPLTCDAVLRGDGSGRRVRPQLQKPFRGRVTVRGQECQPPSWAVPTVSRAVISLWCRSCSRHHSCFGSGLHPFPQARQVAAPVCGARGGAGLGQLLKGLFVPSCFWKGGCAPGCTALAEILGQDVGCHPGHPSRAWAQSLRMRGALVAQQRVWMDQALPASRWRVQAARTSWLGGL